MFRNKIPKKNLRQLVGWGILFILSILVTRIFSSDEIEIKNGFLYNLLTFTLPFLVIETLLILFLIWNIKRENRTNNKKETKGLSSFLLLMLCILFFAGTLFLTVFTPPEKIDAIIYQNHENSDDYVIYQFYLTGIPPDNPKWRVIRTKKKEGSIRKVKMVKDLSKDKMMIGFPIKDSIKKEIQLENDKFKLIQLKAPGSIKNKWNVKDWTTYYQIAKP